MRVGVTGLQLEVAHGGRHAGDEAKGSGHLRLGSGHAGQRLVVVDHPVLADRLTVLRDKTTDHGTFRQALFEASAILAVEAARDLPDTTAVELETPLEPTSGRAPAPRRSRSCQCCEPGWAWSTASCACCPALGWATLGVFRDEAEHRPVDYYERLPPGLPEGLGAFVVDPMLATGGSAVHALNRLKAAGGEPAGAGLPWWWRPRASREVERPPSRRRRLDRRRGSRAGRERLHPARPRRCRGSGVRDHRRGVMWVAGRPGAFVALRETRLYAGAGVLATANQGGVALGTVTPVAAL